MGIMKSVSLGLMIVLAMLMGVTCIKADSLLVDRGLPTNNLNNAAGDDRSNVAWAFADYISNDYWIVGDTFTNTSSSNWFINTITLWTVGRTDLAILRGGIAGSTVGIITDATYGDLSASTYQVPSGSMITMHQVDFAVDITLGPGLTYCFFLDGTGSAQTVVPFAHASNAGLSGSPQQGSDDLMLYAQVINGSVKSDSIGTWTSKGYGWDKASDVNVQVYGRVPEPGSILLLSMGIGMLGLAGWRKK